MSDDPGDEDDVDIDAPLEADADAAATESEAAAEPEAVATLQENPYEAVSRKYNNLTVEQTEAVMLAGLRALQGGQQPAPVAYAAGPPTTESLPDPEAPMTWGEFSKREAQIIKSAEDKAMGNVQRQLDFQNLQNEIDSLPMVQGDPRARKTLLTAALQERAENPYASAKAIVSGVVQTVAQMGSRIVQPKAQPKAQKPAAPQKPAKPVSPAAPDRGVFDTSKVVSISEDFDKRMSQKNSRLLAEMNATQRLK